MLVWDNLQAINWLVGIIEGEADFYLQSGKIPRVCIVNTDYDIIKECSRILNSFMVSHAIYDMKKSNKKHKQAYKIHIYGIHTEILYFAIEKYMECRRDKFDQIMSASTTIREKSLSIGWLIGIWEAEGSFYFTRNPKGSISPRLNLGNTEPQVIEKIELNLKEFKIPYHITNNIQTVRKSFKTVEIGGMKRSKRFLELTKNLWKSSRNIKRSQIMLDFIDSRLSNSNQKQSYSQKELSLYEELAEMNA